MNKPLLFLLAVMFAGGVSAAAYNVRDYGAKGDGSALDSPAIQETIDACTASGGGTVVVPEGTYLSATIQLKDNVTLHLEEGALLLGITDLNQYDWVDPFFDGLGIRIGRTFIAAVDAKNIAIEGKGTIDGQGSAVKEEHIKTDTRPEGERWGERPLLLRVIRCDGVTVKDITLKYSASWTSHYAQSKNIEIENVTILSKGVAHNDGIDLDGCENVTVRNCDIDSGDDALCFKTTHSRYPCRNITVDNMRLSSHQAGIKIGTESMAAFEDIKVTNCHIYDTRNGGIKLFSVDGAHVRNVLISDITMDNVRTPILLRLGSRLSVFRKDTDERQQTGSTRDVTIRNVKAHSAEQTQLTSASGILITGIPGHPISGLTMENIEIELPGGGTVEEGRHEVPEAIDQYPEVKTFGPTIPAYGVWIRHADGVKMNNISFKADKPDLRPVFISEDVTNMTVTAIEAVTFEGSESAVRFDGCRSVYFGIHGLTGESGVVVEISGDSGDINMLGKPQMKVRSNTRIVGDTNPRAASFL